jgi:ribosomal protein S27AE
METKKVSCPHCGHDVSLDGSRVELDGKVLQQGGCVSIEWAEECAACGKEYIMDVDVGPVGVSVRV